ncbi:MAG: lipopolysaccharide biosynthesis protein, partial [Pirellulaceae bacterium]
VQESLITTPYTFFVSQLEKARQKSFAGSTLTSAVVYMTTVTGLLAFVVMILWLAGSRGGFVTILLALVLILPVSLLREFCRRWLFAHLRVPMATLLDAVYAITILGGLWLLTTLDQVTAFYALLVSGLGSLLAVLLAKRFQSDFSLEANVLRSDVNKNLGFGRWTAGASLLSATLMYFAHWYLVATQGEASAGLYAACLTLVFLANPFLLGLSSILAPRAAREFSRHGKPGVRRVVVQYTVVVILVLTAFAGVMGVAGDWLLGFVFEDHYRGNQFTINVLVAAMIGIGINFMLACGLYALVQPRQDLYAAVIGLSLTVLLTVIWKPTDTGTMAVCFASGVFAMALYRMIVFWHLSGVQHESMPTTDLSSESDHSDNQD